MIRISIVALFCAMALSGCAAYQRDAVGDQENLLSAAGFTVLPATTQDRQTMLAELPPNRLSQRIEGEHVSYLYPDLVLCRCLYVGSQAAFGRYQQIMVQRQIAGAQLQAARLNTDFAWDWGVWGGYRGLYY
ncbi:hypothetical protein [Acidisphaera sp. L21]|uniref:hypothetical protein n=1 Tax=Acidisphaera sp. L21 TaxID=1641851 RepID=UPI00131C237E|nr:hypothetical protein [Acidisphaera sp. L21]